VTEACKKLISLRTESTMISRQLFKESSQSALF